MGQKPGSRDLRDVNFFHNAEVNLQKIRNRIRLLEVCRYPSGAVGSININAACPAVVQRLKETTDRQAAYQFTSWIMYCLQVALVTIGFPFIGKNVFTTSHSPTNCASSFWPAPAGFGGSY